MKSHELTELLKLVHEVFPLPNDSTFKGTHSINLKDGTFNINVWTTRKSGEIFSYWFYLDPEDELNREQLVTVRDEIYRREGLN